MISRTFNHQCRNYSVFAHTVLRRAVDDGVLAGWDCSADDYRARRVVLRFNDSRQEVLFKLTYGGAA